ncbi:MAG TPA: tetratricopeptide repeat protein [Phycisphaerales bacterium]|nr:tetratricopeptide repeat protein [Phycisphaerales bacterium]
MTARETDCASNLIAAGEHARAIATLRTALRRDPADADALSLLTTACLRAGDAAGAEGSAQRLVQLMPDDFRAWHNLGNTLLHFGRVSDAEDPLLRARGMAPRDPNVLIALSNLYASTDCWSQSQEVCREGLAVTPDDSRLLANLAVALHGAGRIDEAFPLILQACRQSPGRLDHADAAAAMSTYSPGVGAEESFRLHCRYGEMLEAATAVMAPLGGHARPGPVTVGVVSPDLRDHAVANFIRPVVEHADPEKVRFIAYSLAVREDTVSASLKPLFDAWRHVPFAPHAEVAQRVRSDGVDVLLDLAGHTRGHRLPVFAMRPARAHATWMGYPNTTGLTRMDARISDGIADPSETATFNCERLVHVGPCLVAFARVREPATAERGSDAPIRFVSFSSLLKVNDALIRQWAAVMHQVPGSILTLKHHAIADSGVRANIAARFEAAGLSPDRVRPDLPAKNSAGVLPEYDDADIALDTFPYAGTTTTCEALSMGVPVVTRTGETSASRVGRSLLEAVGLGELVAASEREFVEIAAGLALDRPRLRSVRARVRESYRTSVLADASGFGRRMADVLVSISKNDHPER